MYQKRFLVGQIEYFYPRGMMSDVDVVTNSQHRAIAYVLNKLIVIHLVNNTSAQYGLDTTDFKVDYQISDLQKGMTYEFNYNSDLKLERYIETLTKRYEHHKSIRHLNSELNRECQKQIAEENSWCGLYTETYVNLSLDINLKETETKEALRLCNLVKNFSDIKIL